MKKDDFILAKENAEKFYKNIESVYCPYLREEVSFNSKGLNHIKMKAWNKSRSYQDQYLRLKFISFAPTIIKKSGTLQEIQIQDSDERVRESGNWFKARKRVTYFSFIAVIKRMRFKIIIKKIENNGAYFWSIIPFWKNKKELISKKTKKVFHEGDLRFD